MVKLRDVIYERSLNKNFQTSSADKTLMMRETLQATSTSDLKEETNVCKIPAPSNEEKSSCFVTSAYFIYVA